MRASLMLRGAATVAAITTAAAVGKAIVTGVQSESAPSKGSTPPIRAGNHLVAVLIISESCSAAGRADFRLALNRGFDQLRQNATEHGQRFSTIGVGVSENSPSSRRFLAELATFDQLVVGGGWLNAGVIQYVWRDFAGSSIVPQLLLIRRSVTVSQTEVTVTQDSLLFRLSGADDIIRWVAAGGPVYD